MFLTLSCLATCLSVIFHKRFCGIGEPERSHKGMQGCYEPQLLGGSRLLPSREICQFSRASDTET